MQTDSIRKQAGYIISAIIIASFFTLLWYQLFENIVVLVFLSLTNIVLLLIFIISGFYGQRTTDTQKKQHHAHEDLTNPADLWIWPVSQKEIGPEPIDLNAYDLDDAEQMMAWLEQLMIAEDAALQGNGELSWTRKQVRKKDQSLDYRSDYVDLFLFSLLIWMLGIFALILLKMSS